MIRVSIFGSLLLVSLSGPVGCGEDPQHRQGDAAADLAGDAVSKDRGGEGLDGPPAGDGPSAKDATADAKVPDSGPPPVAPGKFIPSFAIKYCGSGGVQSAQETARFDMLVTNSSHAKVWAAGGKSSWSSLKALNPSIRIVVYQLGPGEYGSSSWADLGLGWSWMKQNHGDGAADRWTARGITYKTYLQRSAYPDERLMFLGNKNWQTYWYTETHAKFWGAGAKNSCTGVDGIFADNTGYKLPGANQWFQVGTPANKDHPQAYYSGGSYDMAKWQKDMNAFFSTAIPWLKGKSKILVPNFGSMGQDPSHWTTLDKLAQRPFAATDETGFVSPYGSKNGEFKYWDFATRLKTWATLKKVRALLTNHGSPVTSSTGLARMNAKDPEGTSGWDALWYALASFLLGYDDVRQSGYMSFTVWGYCEYHWFDELDPKFLHLGQAVGPYFQSGALYLREFQDGWVAVNPSTKAVSGASVPKGQARVINHASFKISTTTPLVTSFDLGPHRGVVLLRANRKIGNQDN